ncbi:MAG: ribosome hibernation-promoting factor, HPF/YfiA family [Acidiferrobacterales bacterium]
MQITVSGQHILITEPLRSYASEKLARVQRRFDYVTTTNVVLHVEKKRHKAEATLYAKGVKLHANAEGETMYAAIDYLADKLDRQVLKHKQKTTTNHHRNNKSVRSRK